MEVKESGSCPQIGRTLDVSHQEAVSHKSSTFISGFSSVEERRQMKRPNRIVKKKGGIVAPIGKTTQHNAAPPPDLIIRVGYPGGDVADETSLRCMLPLPKVRTPLVPANSSASCDSVSIEKRHIDVIVRIRPKHREEEMNKTIVWKISDSAVIFDPREKNADFFYKGKRQLLRNDFGKKRPNKNLTFAFDHVYGQDSTNEEIFKTSLKGLIDNVLNGFNCTVFAYGATGSGKTYTMLGSNDVRGITVLMAEELFRRLRIMKSENFSHDIKVSYLEVYNETIKDLLNPQQELHIREDGKQGLQIPQLTVHTPKGPHELLKLLRNGNSARSQHATDYNAESSRSHAVFEITVLMYHHSPKERYKKRTVTSRLFMVDLAGSEKGSVNIIDGMRQREGSNINKSLLALSSCINALADGKTHIPYRNSKLTRLLKDSLSGNCVTVMIANVSPTDASFEDSYNTLHYASKAKNIKLTCKQNAFSEELVEEMECNNRIKDLQNTVKMLTKQLDEEKRKHRETREMLKSQVGDVSATQLGKNVDHSPSDMHNAVAEDELVELLKQKADLITALTDTSVNTRLHEWEVNWKKLQVHVAEFIGRPSVSDPHFIAFTRMMNNQSDLEGQHPTLIAMAEENQIELRKINTEIESIKERCLQTLKSDAPFYTMTFQEFLSHKEMGMELSMMEKLIKYHRQLEEFLFTELKTSEIHRIHLLKFICKVISNLRDKRDLGKDSHKKFQALLSLIYDPCRVIEPPESEKTIDIKDDLNKIQKTVERGVVLLPRNEMLGKEFVCNLPQIQSSEILVSTTNLCNSGNETSAKDTSPCDTDPEDNINSKSSTKTDPPQSPTPRARPRANQQSPKPSKTKSKKNKTEQPITIIRNRTRARNKTPEEENSCEVVASSTTLNSSFDSKEHEEDCEDLFMDNGSSSTSSAEELSNATSHGELEFYKKLRNGGKHRGNENDPVKPVRTKVKHKGKSSRCKDSVKSPTFLHDGKATTDFTKASTSGTSINNTRKETCEPRKTRRNVKERKKCSVVGRSKKSSSKHERKADS